MTAAKALPNASHKARALEGQAYELKAEAPAIKIKLARTQS